MNTKELIVYNFAAHLEMLDGSLEYWPFQVMAITQGHAKIILDEYLSHPTDTNIKYRRCVGLKPEISKTIIVDKSYINESVLSEMI